MISILKEICNYKKKIVLKQSSIYSKKELIKKIYNMKKTKGFKKKIDQNFKANKISVIAEIKKGSPSKGIIKKKFNPVEIVKNYNKGNATCISILTDEKYFYGKNEDLINIRKHTSIPILRKDFIISDYQIYESRAIGADCILLISSILNKKQILSFTKIAHEIDLDVLIEVHNKEELIDALNLKEILVGINNRNLKNMEVNIENSVELSKAVTKSFNFICESGIKDLKEIQRLIKYDFKSFLIGEFLMKEDKPQKILKRIFNMQTNR